MRDLPDGHSEKILAQAVPIAGSLAGAGLNYAFIDYYQQMARAHFGIRIVERRVSEPSSVRACSPKKFVISKKNGLLEQQKTRILAKRGRSSPVVRRQSAGAATP